MGMTRWQHRSGSPAERRAIGLKHARLDVHHFVGRRINNLTYIDAR
jgi:hypothetical protein